LLFSVVAISVGAALGALLRWVLGTRLNALLPTLPLGTLASNLIGGYLIGVAVAFFATHPALPPEWRLLTVTGFLGGLTTFSTFSSEVVTQLMEGRLEWALATVFVHVLGSIGMTLLGIGTLALFRAMRTAAG
jgi:CrcB protein